jgi:hypothetical protein
MRGRMGGMKPLLQCLLLAQAGEGADRPYESPPSPPEVNFWWVVVAVLAIIAICCFLLSVLNKGKASLWKDDKSEMDSSSDVGSSG